MQNFIENPDPSIYLGNNYVVLDFETDTSHGDYGHPVHPENKLLLACWKVNGGPTRYCWGGEYEQQALLEAIAKADFLVAHNTKYELGWLRRCGADLRAILPFCTKIGEYVLAGNRAAADDKQGLPMVSTALGDVCIRRGLRRKDPVVDRLIVDGINPSFIPRPWLLDRCMTDVEETEKVFLMQREELAESGRLGVAYTRNLLTPALIAMEFRGMQLDPEEVRKEWEAHTTELAKLEGKFAELTGGINWGSPPQVAHYLYDVLKFPEMRDHRGNVLRNKPTKRHPDGTRRTDQDTLEWLESQASTAEQLQFVELKRSLSKIGAALSKNLDYFEGICREKGGMMYSVFNQTRTATQRLSNTGIPTAFRMFQSATKTAQMQNIARVFKKLFKARHQGWLMGEADGASIEFRAAGILTRDPQVKRDVVGHSDIHRFTAATLNGVPESEVSSAMRQDAKPDTFKPLYGGQSGTPAQQRYYKAFREKYSKTSTTQAAWVETVLRERVLRTAWGLRYYWPRARRSRSGYVNVTASVYNYPIQAFATAEVIPIAIVYFWHRLAEEGLEDRIYLSNTVHDSIVCEIHPEAVDEWKKLATTAFTDDVYRYLEKVYRMTIGTTGIPLGVGLKVGHHWSVGDEEKWDVFANGKRERYE